MLIMLTKFKIAKRCLILNAILLLLNLCIVDISFAAEDFPWEIFYPAIIKKSVDKDKDGFTKEQGDCDDSDPSINPDATEICGDGIDQDCDGSDLPCLTCADLAGHWTGHYIEYHCTGVRVDENFSMDIENDCSFTFYFFFGNVNGTWTISNYTISSTVDPGTGQCGLYTNIATVDGNHMEGTISSTGGSTGTFYFDKTN